MNKKFIYQHKYSVVENKAPESSALTEAEIAINANTGNEKLFIKNASGDVVDFPRSYSIKDIDEDMEIIAAALNDLNDRKLDASAKTEVETDTEFDITSDRPLANSAITKTVEEIEKVTSAALNDLNERKLDASAYTFAADEYLFPTDAEYVSSSSTIEFTNISGDTAFSVQLPPMKASLSAGTNIHIEEGEEFDTISVSGASSITSASTEVVQSKAIYEELDKKLDKVNFINNIYPKGSVYITYEYKNPSTFIGGTWELIGGEDADKNYYPAFAIETDTAGTTIDESLPNIKGSVALQSAFNNTFAAAGAFTQDTTLYEEVIDGSGARKRGTIWFNASNSSSIYQDNAHVNVNAIKIFFWRRTDDATIVEQITPLEVDVEDVLWEGSTSTSGEFTLSNSIGNYKYLKFYTSNNAVDTNRMVDRVDVKDLNASSSSARVIIENSWDATLRYCRMYKVSDTSLQIELTSETLLKITGIKNVPTSDATAEVTDVLWEGTSAIEASVNLTLAKSAFDYKEIVFITTNSDTWNQNTQAKSLTLDDYNRIVGAGGTALISFDWDGTSRFVNGIQYLNNGMTLNAWVSGCKIRKVIGIKRYSAIDITAGNGINISEAGVISSTVTFKNYYVNVNMTTQGNFSGTITCESGYVPLGEGSTSIRTNGAIGYGYCDSITKISDTQYKFTGWANPNGTGSGASTITIYATFVKNATVL